MQSYPSNNHPLRSTTLQPKTRTHLPPFILRPRIHKQRTRQNITPPPSAFFETINAFATAAEPAAKAITLFALFYTTLNWSFYKRTVDAIEESKKKKEEKKRHNHDKKKAATVEEYKHKQ